MSSARQTSRYRELTVERARAIRLDEARLAALYADRAERARVTGQRNAMTQWTTEYRRSATTCRRLGERIRREKRALYGAEPDRPTSPPTIGSISVTPASRKAA
jgi:hypothetical protein